MYSQTSSETPATLELCGYHSYEEMARTLVIQLQGDYDRVFSAINDNRDPDYEDVMITLAALTAMTEGLSGKCEGSRAYSQIQGDAAMETEELTMVEFTATNPPKIKSHSSWEEVYGIIRSTNNNHEDPYFLEVNGMAVSLMCDDEGNVDALLQPKELAYEDLVMLGGVWIVLSE